MANSFWKKYGYMTAFPSKVSYIAYVRDTHKQIKKMDATQYAQYVSMCSQTQVDKLQQLLKGLENKKKELQNPPPDRYKGEERDLNGGGQNDR